MEVNVFMGNFREAFGDRTRGPIAFWYSGAPAAEPRQINGCMFKGLKTVDEGSTLTLSGNTMTCGGGKFYCGFSPMPERVPGFVSLTEKYKQTPEMVVGFLRDLGVPASDKPYLNMTLLDNLDSFDGLEGLLFVVGPDALSGLATWAYFDNNDPSAVSTLFGSGCSATVTQAVLENRSGGRRTFLSGFDPSVRPWLKPDELFFTIPMSRFAQMYDTMRASCLFGTHAWGRLRERM